MIPVDLPPVKLPMGAVKDYAWICSSLASGGYSIRLRGFSAIDLYMGLPALPFLWAETDADIAVLARLIENLRFPGVETADGAADTPGGTCYFRCLDPNEQNQNNCSFPLLSFAYDWKSQRFKDPMGVYPLLRELRDRREHFLGGSYNPDANHPFKDRTDTGLSKTSRCRIMMDAALLLARYCFKTGAFTAATRAEENCPPEVQPGPEMQRAFLSCLLVSPRPELGLEFLKRAGFLHEFWPELASFDDVDHSKEFHPEGNVWKHTMETLRYRKATAQGFDLRLSLALLLHDIGKPLAESSGRHRFNGHAELGERQACHFLERLGFEIPLVRDVCYLVRNHMLPAALPRLPLTRTGEIMSSLLFPTLLELYRCDESSSFKGLDGYYQSSAVYQSYLKYRRSPYRSADGKKLKREHHNWID
jgi:poly(A) polymerase